MLLTHIILQDNLCLKVASLFCFAFGVLLMVFLVVTASLQREGGLVSLTTSYLIYILGVMRHYINTR